MSNQSKVTDFFVAQKKTDNTFRSVKKIGENVIHSVVNKSDIDESSFPAIETPKRKKVVTKSLNSSKRKKTPKSEVIIEFKPQKIETKEETNVEIISKDKPEVNPKTEKLLNVKQIKERLKKCNNLLELKKQLSTINDCAAKVKQFKEIKIKSPTKKIFRTPTKKHMSPSKQSPRRPILSNTPITPSHPHKSPMRVTPNKDSDCAQTYRRRLFDVFEDEISSPKKADNNNLNLNQKQRAFERFSYLVDNTEDNRTLVLPQKFKVLSDFFKAIDTIVSMHHKRQEICTFDKLKTSVERLTSRKFDLKKLAQIQTIFPNAFKLKYELFSSTLSNQKPSHQLVITPVYNSNVDIRLNSSHLLERHQIFVNKLLDITKGHHKQYLNGLGITVEDKDLVRWHPKFRLDSIPDIETNDNALPSEPKFGGKSAEDFLETTRQRLGLPSTITTNNDNKDNSNDNQNIDNKSTKKIANGLLKGISIDLLNKIRAKEAANLVQEMTRKPEVENELRILRTLPEIVRIIHSFFIGSKKMAVHYDEVIDKIINSFSASLSILRAREHVDYLCSLLPDWIYLLEVKKGNYLKINKQTNLSSLEDRINKKMTHLKKFQ